jgi:FKBP-type peptidyl-prolyl cis-trans isomerase (trigger factor)
MDFKEQGSTDEQLAEMMTPEKYEKYKDISRPNVEKVVKLGMVFRDLAEKEKIDVTENEIEEQMSMIKMQAKQKGEEPPPESDTRAEIENVLLRKKVFDMLASTAEITWIEAPEPVQ